MRLVARGFEQTVNSDADLFAGTPKVTTLRGLLTIDALHGSPVVFGDCHCASHQSPMPSESEPVFVDSSGLEYSQHTKNQRHELQPVEIRSFDVREETYTTMR